jgi:N-methylhydantoinase A/oxoprolinase/acetone carboxylase beta subunit
MGWIVGCDTGGTFTDVFALSDAGESRVAKVPSTPPRFDVGVVEGVEALGIEPSQVDTLFHGTTVTTNAVITKTGAPAAVVATRGFRDILEIRRANREELYDILWDPPPPLVPRRHRLEVDERVDYAGHVVRPLDEESVRDVARSPRSSRTCTCRSRRTSSRSRPSSSAPPPPWRTRTARRCCARTWTRSRAGSPRRASAATSCSSCTTAVGR